MDFSLGVTRETGGGWWVVLASWHCPTPLEGHSTHDPPSEQLHIGIEVGAGQSVVVVRCWGWYNACFSEFGGVVRKALFRNT